MSTEYTAAEDDLLEAIIDLIEEFDLRDELPENIQKKYDIYKDIVKEDD